MCSVTRWSSPNREHGEAVLSVLPFYHMNGLVNGFLNAVLRHALVAIGGRFSVSRFWSIVEQSGARHVNLLGAMSALLARMDDVPEIARTRGRLRVAGGAPYPPDVARIWRERFGAEIVGSAAFGLTECAPVASTPRGVTAPVGCSGRSNDLFDLRLLDEEDREVPPGAVGEICVRPRVPGVMFSGYWRRPEATVEALRNLWFHTGDLARFDDEGWLYFVDRKKDYLRRRGENISSQEVEHVILTHPRVRQAALHSVESAMAEDDDLKLTVVMDGDGPGVSEYELYEWLARNLPAYALPRYIEYRDDLPVTASGRVRKQVLRESGIGQATWERPSGARSSAARAG
jgi:crotonobetaine/carnitine-CoA ligase